MGAISNWDQHDDVVQVGGWLRVRDHQVAVEQATREAARCLGVAEGLSGVPPGYQLGSAFREPDETEGAASGEHSSLLPDERIRRVSNAETGRRKLGDHHAPTQSLRCSPVGRHAVRVGPACAGRPRRAPGREGREGGRGRPLGAAQGRYKPRIVSDSLGPGVTFAGCRLEAVAGRGGMGVVYRATQLALRRPVALKAIAPELAADGDYRERFERESHLAASLDHPNVIPVYEAGERDGTLYLIMRWVEGTDLQAVLRSSGRVSPGRAIRLLRPVAAALAAAHRRGLIHRDVKPANVLIAGTDEDPEEQIYLTDFGIARLTDGESITRTGMFVGTIDYTAPERIEGERGYAPSDITRSVACCSSR